MRVRGKTKEIRIYTRASRPGTIKVLSTGFAFSPWPSGKCARLFPTSRSGDPLSRHNGWSNASKGGVWSEPRKSFVPRFREKNCRWIDGGGNDLVNDRDIKHCFSSSSRCRFEEGGRRKNWIDFGSLDEPIVSCTFFLSSLLREMKRMISRWNLISWIRKIEWFRTRMI